jgi:hypothetical protein
MIELLDRLEAAAKEAQGGEWIGPQDKSRRFSAEFAYLYEANPTTILRLVRVARAAQRVDDDMREWNGVPSDAAARELRAAWAELGDAE